MDFQTKQRLKIGKGENPHLNRFTRLGPTGATAKTNGT